MYMCCKVKVTGALLLDNIVLSLDTSYVSLVSIGFPFNALASSLYYSIFISAPLVSNCWHMADWADKPGMAETLPMYGILWGVTSASLAAALI